MNIEPSEDFYRYTVRSVVDKHLGILYRPTVQQTDFYPVCQDVLNVLRSALHAASCASASLSSVSFLTTSAHSAFHVLSPSASFSPTLSFPPLPPPRKTYLQSCWEHIHNNATAVQEGRTQELQAALCHLGVTAFDHFSVLDPEEIHELLTHLKPVFQKTLKRAARQVTGY